MMLMLFMMVMLRMVMMLMLLMMMVLGMVMMLMLFMMVMLRMVMMLMLLMMMVLGMIMVLMLLMMVMLGMIVRLVLLGRLTLLGRTCTRIAALHYTGDMFVAFVFFGQVRSRLCLLCVLCIEWQNGVVTDCLRIVMINHIDRDLVGLGHPIRYDSGKRRYN